MHWIKNLVLKSTNYWIHKESSLPLGADLILDFKNRLKIKNPKVIFDVGANIGQTVEKFLSEFPNTNYFCFEPVEKTYTQLINNTSGTKNIHCYKLALSEQKGMSKIFLSEDNSLVSSMNSDSFHEKEKFEEIETDTLDNIVTQLSIDSIDILKIDTEGFELKVLEGAKNLLKSNSIKAIYAEVGFSKIDKMHTNFVDLIEFLELYNFRFISTYEMVLSGFKDDKYYGNALFVHKSIINQ